MGARTTVQPFLVVASGNDDQLIREWTANRFPAQHNDPRKVVFIDCFPNDVEGAMDKVEGQFLNHAETVILRVFHAGPGTIRIIHRYVKANSMWSVEWQVFQFKGDDPPLPDVKLCRNIELCPTNWRDRVRGSAMW